MDENRWEDELIKMKMCGINIVSTYVFWIHHEEEEGVFRFDGRRNLRKFVELCAKHGFYVILRVGPFDHGEVRNGGMPDWLYGKPFEVRTLDKGFMQYVRRLYTRLGVEVQGLFYKEDGPIIGVQIDNEYMHSSAPWEMTTGISNEWIFGGNEGNAYMLGLKELAAECGLLPVFYTCTGWGGAATPDTMLPLWGGYAFRPWLFYSYKGEHPATEEYVYQDFHNNEVTCTSDFHPAYDPETRPYACCEMGGGMMCSYYYRFQLPYKSVDAMANIKIASGCNFLGYYMFQGGSNPTGKYGTFLNESQVPKISYDYQAALGEFGQERESYRRLKSIHYFAEAFGDRLCTMQTVLPDGASMIDPQDADTLRYAVRYNGRSGFLFLNNYQDHFDLPDRKDEKIILKLLEGNLTWNLDIASEENAILPFHFDMEGIDLIQANAQVITKTEYAGETTYVFFIPDGMKGSFVFEENARINGTDNYIYRCEENLNEEYFTVEKGTVRIGVLVLSRALANDMFRLQDGRLLFADASVMEENNQIRLESTKHINKIHIYPSDALENMTHSGKFEADPKIHSGEYAADFSGHLEKCKTNLYVHLGTYQISMQEKKQEVDVHQVGSGRYTLHLPENVLEDVKDVLLQIEYTGDIGNAFIHGRMIHDNFANGALWEIGLKDFEEELKENDITVYIVPLKEGANVNVESSMAARSEQVESSVAELKKVSLQTVYEFQL
jgi:hypothetical protein